MKRDIDFDPVNGYVVQEVWEGSKAAIYGLATAYEALGYKAHREHDGPAHMCYVTIGGLTDGSPEVPVDDWEIDDDYVQEDLWSNPKVIAAAGTDDILASWRGEIEDALAAKKTVTKTGFSGTKKELFVHMRRGAIAHEISRPVLIRNRSISPRYAQRAVIESISKVYATAALIRVEGIPNDIRAKLPADPADVPSYTVWGWKRRKNNSKIERRLNKALEEKSWVFSAWATTFYDVVLT